MSAFTKVMGTSTGAPGHHRRTIANNLAGSVEKSGEESGEENIGKSTT
jgi:hypothetical protein